MTDYNAADTRAIRRAAKLQRQAEAERDIVITGLVSTPAGRSYVHDLLVRCHVFVSSFSSTALSMAFAEGERNIGLQILSDVMRAAPDQYVQMMREENDRHISSRRLRDNQNPDGRDKQPSSPTGDDRAAPGPQTEYDPYATEGGGDRAEDSPQ